MQTNDFLAGIFIGGQSKRLFGTPKGLLQAPGSTETLVEHLAESLNQAGIERIVLVGENAAYDQIGWPVVGDSKLGQGPMAGLLGLVEHALSCDIDMVLAIACDMPFVNAALLRRLRSEHLQADALVPKRERREPLCARYRATAILPMLQQQLESGNYRMMEFLDALGPRCVELSLEPDERQTLDDWDCPGDLPQGVRIAGRLFGSGAK